MGARPLGNFVAVTPCNQGRETYEGSNLINLGLTKTRGNYLSGTVLAVGKLVEAVKPGDRVVYEIQSAHPGQDKAISAEVFGGNDGDWAFLIPCYHEALPSVASIDTELELRNKSIEGLRSAASFEALSDVDQELFAKQSHHIERLKRERTRHARGASDDTILSKARGRGIVAVIGDDDGQDC